MATSRTGTAKWKRVVKQAKKEAQARGQRHCPYCKVTLNYEVGRTPASAEGDHIIPHSRGGQDTLANCQVICRRCNQSKGKREKPKLTVTMTVKPLKTSRKW